jgi:two-component system cell cycle sensor histidine kinase/response regulator CckA
MSQTTLTPTDPTAAAHQRLETVGRLMRGLSQELDRLLRAVLADASLLDGALAPEQSRARDYLDELEQAARRASETVARIVALAQRPHGTGAPVAVAPTVRALVGLLHDLLADVVTLSFVAESDEALRADADAATLEELLLGLVADARDASPRGGTIEVVLWKVAVGRANAAQYPRVTPGPYVGFTVRDAGSGPRPGLEAARALAERSGGFVTVDEVPGAGASVRVHLPAAKPEASRRGS